MQLQEQQQQAKRLYSFKRSWSRNTSSAVSLDFVSVQEIEIDSDKNGMLY